MEPHMEDRKTLEENLTRVVKTYAHLGMSWQDVHAVATQLRNKKIQDILTSTLSSLSLQELSVAQEQAYQKTLPPTITATEPVSASYIEPHFDHEPAIPPAARKKKR